MRVLPILAVTLLVGVAPASAHHSDDGQWDEGGDWSSQMQDGGDSSGSGQDWANDDGSGWYGDTGSVDGGGWNAEQGDVPEDPASWGTPPRWATGDPSNGKGGNTGGTQPGKGGWQAWPNVEPLPISTTPTVSGKQAMLRRNGLAAIPRGAPARVRAILLAANQIIGRPYKWGGGHGRLFDSGYDCSGSVSYALIRSGVLSYPMVSGTFARWAARGAGKYVTIYANKAHVYMEVAGLRLDTSPVGDPGGKSGVRWRPPIGKRFGFAVRHVSGI